MDHIKSSFQPLAGPTSESFSAYARLESIFAEYVDLYRSKFMKRGLIWRDDVLFDKAQREGGDFEREHFEEDQAAIQQKIYELLTQPDPGNPDVPLIKTLMEKAEDSLSGFSPTQQANLREMKWDYDMERTSVENNPDFAQALHQAKLELKDDSPYEDYIPHIDRFFQIARETVEPLAAEKGVEPAQLLLNRFNRYVTIDSIEADLNALERVAQSVQRAGAMHKERNPEPLPLPSIPVEKQVEYLKVIAEKMMDAAGLTAEVRAQRGLVFEFLPQPTLAFAMGDQHRQIVAVEINEDYPLIGLQNALHEVQHAIREFATNDLPPEIRDQPAGQPHNYGMHEVVALFSEQASKQRGFFEEIRPILKDALGEVADGPEFSTDNMLNLVHNYDLSNEGWSVLEAMTSAVWVTRAEIAMIRGELTAADLPSFYADQTERLTGRRPSPEEFYGEPLSAFYSYARDGYMLYYNTYITGMKAATAMYTKFQAENQAALKEDYFGAHARFIRENINRHGAVLRPNELYIGSVGRIPSVGDISSYLTRHIPEDIKADAGLSRAERFIFPGGDPAPATL